MQITSISSLRVLATAVVIAAAATLASPAAFAGPVIANDLCGNATPIGIPSLTSGTTAGATFDSAPFCGTTNTAPGVWYSVIGNGTQLTASFCTGGDATYDTKLSVYEDGCGALICVVGNDDFPNCPNFHSEVSWCGEAGVEYLILVHGFSTATGTFDLNLTSGAACPAYPNDTCETAIAVDVPSMTAGSTVGAGVDGTPFCGTSNTAPGVWYSVTGTGNTMTASLCIGTDYDSKLTVYCSCEDLTCVGGNDDFCGLFLPSQVTWCSQAGATYQILVHGFLGDVGNFNLVLSDDGASCSGAVACIPGGACCFENGECVIDPKSCASLGGVFLGEGTLCGDAGACPPVKGACCLPPGTCIDTAPLTCLDLGGIFQGIGVSCATAQCRGACCYIATQTCTFITEGSCNASGGLYQGDGVSCTEDCTVQGACCLGAPCVCVRTDGPTCLAEGGFYLGNFTSCDDVDCDEIMKDPDLDKGACCMSAGTCVDTTEEACGGLGGQFNELSCATVDCQGACCFPGTGTCDARTRARCRAAGGVWQGSGTLCIAGCNQVGACCSPNPGCHVTAGEDCQGDWQGPGTVCNVIACPIAAVACFCDLDGDRIVGFSDVLSLLSAWGDCPAPCQADITVDENVGFADLLTMLSEFGATCGE